jgi:hypothetical protein
VKIDQAGNKEWDKRFGGMAEETCTSLQQTADGGYILGGLSFSGIGGDKTQASWGQSNDYWIVKLDSSGLKQWDKRFGGIAEDYLSALQQTSDGGYILAGITFSDSSGDRTEPLMGISDYWIVKIDSIGNLKWDKRFGGSSVENDFGNIFETADSGFLLTGTSYSPRSGDKSENNLGVEQTWIIKTDALANKQWDKTLYTRGHDEFGYSIQTKTGCYVVVNSTTAGVGGYKTQSGWGSEDYWLLKFCEGQCNLTPPSLNSIQTALCTGDSARVCAASGYLAYLWNSGEISSCINAHLAGNYYVTVTDANGCTAESNHLAITVLQPPPVSISINGDTLSVYNSVSQQWNLNGTAINGATSNIFITTQSGSYTVMVTDSNGCTATSSAVIISGMDNLSEEDVVSVYPNPLTNGSWALRVGNNYIGGLAEIFDAHGKFVFQTPISGSHSLLTPEVANGVYLLRISAVKKSSIVKKLVRL